MRKTSTNGPSGIDTKGTDAFGIQALRFVAHLKGLGYAPWTVKNYGCGVNHLAAVVAQHNIALSELREARAVELLSERKPQPSSQKLARRGVVLFARFLKDQAIVSPPMEPVAEPKGRALLLRDFESYLRNERGVSDSTTYHCALLAEQFLKFRFGDGEDDLPAIAPGGHRRVHSAASFAEKAVPGEDGADTSAELFSLSLSGGQDENQPCDGHPQRCSPIWCKVVSASDNRAG